MQALGNGALRNAVISIASKVENAADELKTKLCAHYVGCPIGLIQDAFAKTCQLPVVQGSISEAREGQLACCQLSFFQ